MPYPIIYNVAPPEAPRNRLTVFFRPILAIPHLLIVGFPLYGGAASIFWSEHDSRWNWGWNSSNGVLGAVVWLVTIYIWFAILFTGRYPSTLWPLANLYLRWRANAATYIALLRDEYPPFGTYPYPIEFILPYEERHNRLTTFFRLFLVIPQVIVLAFLYIAWWVTLVIGWFAILFTGRYPEGIWEFGAGVLRWSLRVEAYVLLLVDEYPPFRLSN